MFALQIVGVLLVAIGLLLLFFEFTGNRITESKWLGMSGPVGLVLLPVGVVLIILG